MLSEDARKTMIDREPIDPRMIRAWFFEGTINKNSFFCNNKIAFVVCIIHKIF